MSNEISWRVGIYSMVVADGLMPVWHQGIGSNHDGKYRPISGLLWLLLYVVCIVFVTNRSFLCDIFNHYVWICSHLVKPCLIHVESVSSWIGGLGLASGPLKYFGHWFQIQFEKRTHAEHRRMPRFWLGTARNFTRHIFVSTQTVISVSRIAVV